MRLRTLFRRMVAWTSGEAYKPGPTKSVCHVNDVRIRFHNARGRCDDRFRTLYLKRARETCDILIVAETNCPDDDTGRKWSRDWQRSNGVYWAHASGEEEGKAARGMGLFIADSLYETDALGRTREPIVLWMFPSMCTNCCACGGGRPPAAVMDPGELESTILMGFMLIS